MLLQRDSSDVVSNIQSDHPYNAALTCITRVLVCNLSAMYVYMFFMLRTLAKKSWLRINGSAQKN